MSVSRQDGLTVASRQAEVHQIGLTSIVQHDVRRLHVAVNNELVVCVVQCVGHRSNEPHSFLRPKAAVEKCSAERTTGNECRDDKRPLGSSCHVKNRHEARLTYAAALRPSRIKRSKCFSSSNQPDFGVLVRDNSA